LNFPKDLFCVNFSKITFARPPLNCKRSSPPCDFQALGTYCRAIPYTIKGKFADDSAIHSFVHTTSLVASDANVKPVTESREGTAEPRSALDDTAKVHILWTCDTLGKDAGKGEGTGSGQAQS
jgi:hypothetical protein